MIVNGFRAAALPLLLLLASIDASHAQTARCEPELAAQKYPTYAGRPIKIATSPSQPPYTFADPRNPDQMAGLEVEAIEKAISCAGLKFEYVKGAWSGLLPALFSGSLDVMIGNVNYRPDRAQRADFIVYMRAGQSVLVPKGNPKKLTEMSSLCGLSGSATLGGSSALQVEQQSKICVAQGKSAISFVPSSDSEAAYRQLGNERIDFAMDDAASAAIRLRRQPDFQLAYTVISDIVSGMVVTKGNTAMLKIVEDGLKVQEQDGALTGLARKYGLPAELLIPIQTRQ